MGTPRSVYNFDLPRLPAGDLVTVTGYGIPIEVPVRNTGDDALAMWSEKTEDAHDVFDHNTVQTPVLANGIALDVWEEGPADAPALIFLHGFPESLRAWRHQIAHLSPRFRCIAPDQRGYGRSSRPAGVADYALPLLAGDIIALADALGLPRFGLIAHDWGAMVAWALAHRHPARLTHLAIANGPHPAIFQRRLWCDDAQRRASQYIRALRDPAADVLIAQQGLGALLA